MTPMRKAFVTVLGMVEHYAPGQDRDCILAKLLELLDLARDPEEAGAAARFAAAAILLIEACEDQTQSTLIARRTEFELMTQVLIAEMLLRRGRVKERQPANFSPLPLLSLSSMMYGHDF